MWTWLIEHASPSTEICPKGRSAAARDHRAVWREHSVSGVEEPGLVPSSPPPSFRDERNAPREIRTPTVQTDHKALNLARDLLHPSERHR